MRALAWASGVGLGQAGFHVIPIENNSPTSFENAWREEGLWAVIYGGHGADGAVVVDPKNGLAVYASEVSPRYKLGHVSLYGCETMVGGWDRHVGRTGLFCGFDASVHVWDAWAHYRCINGR